MSFAVVQRVENLTFDNAYLHGFFLDDFALYVQSVENVFGRYRKRVRHFSKQLVAACVFLVVDVARHDEYLFALLYCKAHSYQRAALFCRLRQKHRFGYSAHDSIAVGKVILKRFSAERIFAEQ